MSYFDDIRQAVVGLLTSAGSFTGGINTTSFVPLDTDTFPTANVYIMMGMGNNTATNANLFNSEIIITIDIFDTNANDMTLAAQMTTNITNCLNAVFTDHQLISKITIKRYSFQTDLSVEDRTNMAKAQISITGAYINDYDFTFPEVYMDEIGMDIHYADHIIHSEDTLEE